MIKRLDDCKKEVYEILEQEGIVVTDEIQEKIDALADKFHKIEMINFFRSTHMDLRNYIGSKAFDICFPDLKNMPLFSDLYESNEGDDE